VNGDIGVFGYNAAGRTVLSGVDVSTWPDLKFARAVAHASGVMDLMRAWDASRRTWLEMTMSDDGFHLTGLLRVEAEPPLDELALRLGDSLHNFRGALDALVWGLCGLDEAPEPSVEKRIQFPCFTKEAEWDRAVATTLASMPADFRARLMQFQPFGQSAPTSPLQWLVTLSNQDKHRGSVSPEPRLAGLSLPISTGGATGSRNGIDNGLRMQLADPMPFVDGAMVVSVEFSVQVTLTQSRVPIPLDYAVSDSEGNSAQLVDLLAGLASLGDAMEFIRTGVWPPERRVETVPE
jgi:hypothetical protein